MSLQPGTIETMHVARKIDTGYVLTNGEEEILLHHNDSNNTLEENEEVEVFLYHDKDGKTVATTTIPTITRLDHDWAEVAEVIPKLGAFVHIGIRKDMLIPRDDLPKFRSIWPKVGDKLLVKLDLDNRGLLIAVPATGSVIAEKYEEAPDHMLNKTVSGYVYFSSREGTEIFTDQKYRGFIHHTERKREPRLGEHVTGRVIDVKEDGTINVSLIPVKRDSIPIDAEAILQYLEENNGVIPFSDKSDPEEIRSTFKISKAAFKRALGSLMKQGKVKQENRKTYLIEEKR
jgi:hypothetical protein